MHDYYGFASDIKLGEIKFRQPLIATVKIVRVKYNTGVPSRERWA
jgi:hypothetical protein